MPVNEPTGGSDIIGDAASRRKQDRVSRILGMRDIVQPQGPQDAQSIISRMAGAAKPKTANDPTRGSQYMPNEGKSSKSPKALPNPVDATKAYRPNAADAVVHCKSCGPTTLTGGVKGFPSDFGNNDPKKKPDDPVDAAKPFGKPKDDSTAAKPDAPTKPAKAGTTMPCPTCGQDAMVSFTAPTPAMPAPGTEGAMPQPPQNDATAQPQAPTRDVGQGYAAPNFPGHGMPGTQGPNPNLQPPPGNSTPSPGQPAIQGVGLAQTILQQIGQLPVDQLDPIKRAIDQRMSVVRSPMQVPGAQPNPVDQARSNYGQKALEDASKVDWHHVAHFVYKHRKELAAVGLTLAHAALRE